MAWLLRDLLSLIGRDLCAKILSCALDELSTQRYLQTPNRGPFVIGAEDGVVKVWDISDGSLLLTVPEAGEEIGMITCCCDDEVIVASSKRGIAVISFETGEILHR